MLLESKRYRSEQNSGPNNINAFTVNVEFANKRKYITIELDNTNKWRTKDEYIKYLRWCITELEQLKIGND